MYYYYTLIIKLGVLLVKAHHVPMQTDKKLLLPGNRSIKVAENNGKFYFIVFY